MKIEIKDWIITEMKKIKCDVEWPVNESIEDKINYLIYREIRRRQEYEQNN